MDYGHNNPGETVDRSITVYNKDEEVHLPVQVLSSAPFLRGTSVIVPPRTKMSVRIEFSIPFHFQVRNTSYYLRSCFSTMGSAL